MSSLFHPGEVWLDNNRTAINAHGAGLLHHEGVYYWFGEHKVEGAAGNRAEAGVHVYHSSDLYNWVDGGIALPVSDDPTSEIVRGCPNAGVWPFNVPDELKRPLDTIELAKVTALDLPGGPRPYYPKHTLFRRDFVGGQMARDMTLFVDDDGTAYHFYASEDNGTLHISQLSDDYLRPAGKYGRIFPGRFHEAPAIMKGHGRYFLFTSDCTGWAPNAARLSVANSIWGPWEELGNPCIGTGAQIANTFESQPTFILPVSGREEAFIFLADRWRPNNAIDGRYVWLPIQFEHDVPVLRWCDRWNLSSFDR
jgi:hypothetical protein